MKRKEFEDFAYTQMKKFNVPLPETYTAEELIEYNPEIPVDFIRDHVSKRV